MLRTNAFAVAVMLALPPMIAGCPPMRLPEPSNCQPWSSRCSATGQPQVCSATRRWTPVGDIPCAQALAGARCVAPSPDASAASQVAHCAAP